MSQVWSFSPPEDELFDDEFRSSSPLSMPDHVVDFLADGSSRHGRRPASEDISMIDAFESGKGSDFKGKKRR
jgi:F-box and WD-40 domain protein CDC4